MKAASPPPDNEEYVSRPTLLRLGRLWTYALEKPVVFTVLFYGYVSVIGLFYNTTYFDRFGIAILEFYEVQDFLLGGLRTPVILLVPLVLILSAFFMGILLLYIQRGIRRFNRSVRTHVAAGIAKEIAERPGTRRPRFLRYNNFMEQLDEKMLWLSRYIIFAHLLGATAFSVLMIIILAFGPLSDRSHYCTYIAEGLLSDSPLVLLGTSQGFYFLGRFGTLEVEVIPRKEVLRMTKMGTASTVCAAYKSASPPWL